jgi:hypothetical protein
MADRRFALRTARYAPAAALLAGLALVACAPAGEAPTYTAPQDAFWENLSHQCGNAYAGRLGVAPPGDDMVAPDQDLVVHFRECGEEELKLPFHIAPTEADGEWDRSRTWVFMRRPGELEIRHDHRHADGSEDEVTWYGAVSAHAGSAYRQEFLLPPDDRPERGWRVEIVPDERYTYGTIREGEWSWRVDFDLSEPVAEPPPPWGHETPPSRIPYPL